MAEPEHEHPADYSETKIRRVNWPDDIGLVRRLFTDYRNWIAEHAPNPDTAEAKASPGLAHLDRVLAAVPTGFSPPKGDVLLSFKGDGLAAVGALHELEPGMAELTRIYVRGDHRGPDYGQIWVRAMLERAQDLGYDRVRSYTMPSMAAAIQFYQDLGFKPIEAYWPHPVPGALFFEWTGKRAHR